MTKKLFIICTLSILLVFSPAFSHKKDYLLYLTQAKNLIKKHEYQKALDLISKATAEEPRSIEVLFLKGTLHIRLDQSDDAVHAFQRVITLDPKNYKAYAALGCLSIANNYTHSMSLFQIAESLAPKDPQIILTKALALAIIKRPEESKKEITKAMSIAPPTSKTFYRISMIYMFLENYNKALQYINKATKLNPTPGALRVKRAILKIQRKK